MGVKKVVDVSLDQCSGGAFAAIVLFCNEVLGSKAETYATDFSTQFGGTVQLSRKTKSNEWSTRWSYQTSQDPWTAGAMSDVFVVPNLNVMYEDVYEVDWDNARCSVKEVVDSANGNKELPVKTTFDVKPPSSESALSFYSRYHIEYVKLPELHDKLNNLLW